MILRFISSYWEALVAYPDDVRRLKAAENQWLDDQRQALQKGRDVLSAIKASEPDFMARVPGIIQDKAADQSS